MWVTWDQASDLLLMYDLYMFCDLTDIYISDRDIMKMYKKISCAAKYSFSCIPFISLVTMNSVNRILSSMYFKHYHLYPFLPLSKENNDAVLLFISIVIIQFCM